MDDNKQYLNLSPNAFYMMNCDASAFAGKKVSMKRVEGGFLNRIFLNFLKDREKMLILLKKDCRYLKGTQFNFRLWIQAEEQLISIEKQKHTELYRKFAVSDYFSRSRLLKAIFEEYALLPYYERERIYFREEFEHIQLCCESSHEIKFDSRNARGKRHNRMIPYDIRLDEWSAYNYLIGMTEEGKILNFRISLIENICTTSRKIILSKEQKQSIEDKIFTNGVQFLSGEPEKIKVRLSMVGQNMYHTMIHLRPHCTAMNPDTGIYDFFCTPLQARYYFFKFGKEAEFIEPDELRNQLIQSYYAAIENYQEHH